MNREPVLEQTDDFTINFKQDIPVYNSELNNWHDSCELSFYVKAQLCIFLKDRQYDIKDGDLFFIGENEIHRIIYNKQNAYDRYILNFKHRYIRDVLCALDVPFLLDELYMLVIRRANLAYIQRDQIEGILRELVLLYKNKNTAAIKLSLIKLLMICKQHLMSVQNNKEENIRNTVIRKIIYHIDKFYMFPLKLEDIEKDYFISKFHFIRLFSKLTGMTPVNYLQQRRVIEACNLLRTTNRGITDICLDCGFNNIQHFHRVFKKVSGTTPGRYRARVKSTSKKS